MAGLRPPRADSPAARLLTGGTDYRVPLTTSQADRYRQVYSQIKVRYFFCHGMPQKGLAISPLLERSRDRHKQLLVDDQGARRREHLR
jgi:hypothetical protein